MAVPRFFVLLLLLVAVAVVAAPAAAADNLQEACDKTLFPKVCTQALNTNPETRTASPRRLAEVSVYVAKEVGTTVAAFAHHELSGVKDDVLFKCLDGCSDDIEEAVAHLSALTRELTDAKFLEVKSWLMATLGGTSTCEEGCKDAPISDVKNAVVTKSLEFEKLLRVTLDLITEASGSMSANVALSPSSWSASAPGSYGASAPVSTGLLLGSSYGSSGKDGDEASPSSSDAPADAPSSDDADAPSPGADDDVPSPGDADAPSSDAAGSPSPGDDDDAPSSGAAGAPSDEDGDEASSGDS